MTTPRRHTSGFIAFAIAVVCLLVAGARPVGVERERDTQHETSIAALHGAQLVVVRHAHGDGARALHGAPAVVVERFVVAPPLRAVRIDVAHLGSLVSHGLVSRSSRGPPVG